ncbi:uncharacterized protein LOC107740851 [Sinocyclocheilus rhinocerous]|uniref:uncharacterized protein LOC107740851 n=1 Tax=Sinocyclocheilus rhinocerous TaxID=307959 RepID=UPI0007B9DA23|nr:PREDICTED: uncharacterized protein LOC107740851 [Sinocyclocheilus rhinocerous]
MNAVNAVQLFILVWTFTAVCQADDDVIVSCQNVTGSVGKEVTLTCSVSLQCTEYCIKNYKFQYPESFNDSVICHQDFPNDPCEQRNSFTCSYTPTTAMTEQFTFFVQTNCGMKRAGFTVDTSVSSGRMNPENPSGSSPPETAAGVKDTVITVLVSGFILILILIIMMAIICNTKPNSTKLCRFQNWMFLSVRHDEDNDRPENEI